MNYYDRMGFSTVGHNDLLRSGAISTVGDTELLRLEGGFLRLAAGTIIVGGGLFTVGEMSHCCILQFLFEFVQVTTSSWAPYHG